MKKYCISYITSNGVTVLNLVQEAKSFGEAIELVKNDGGIQLILSCVEIKY